MTDNQGLAYEREIATACRRAARNVPGLSVSRGTAGTSASKADLTLTVDRKKVPLEVKLNSRALMGACRVSFNLTNHAVAFSNDPKATPPDEATSELILAAMRQKRKELEDLIGFIKKQEPSEINGKIKGTPMICTQDAWNAAVKEGLLAKLNDSVKYNADYVARHYARKGVTYIQIGKCGLFHMSDNPLNLDVPKFAGEINIEIRLKNGGAKPRGKDKIMVIDASMTASARLQGNPGRSRYSLDRTDDVLALFGAPTMFANGLPMAAE